jgi:hypothetical protein
MNYTSFFSFQFLLILLIAVSCINSEKLFEQDSENWEVYGDANWAFSDDVLIGKVMNGSGYIMTAHSFADFILDAEFMPDSTINSGIFIRCTNKEINPFDCYELNIWDLHPDQSNRTGAIVAKNKPLLYVETINKWNTYRIKAHKGHLQVWINDTLTADTILNDLYDGFIGLQAQGNGTIKFRDISISALK